MSLRVIKQELESLCTDLYDGNGEGWEDRIRKIRTLIIQSDQWITKTAHLKLKACQAIWRALLPNNPQGTWEVNRVDGYIEEAIRIDQDERQKGIPKALKASANSQDGTERFLAQLSDDLDGGMTPADLHVEYEIWMHREAPDDEVLTLNAFAQRLAREGFEKTSRKINGKTERVWKVALPATL